MPFNLIPKTSTMIFLSIFGLSSYAQKPVNFSELIEKEGLYMLDNKPFSGKSILRGAQKNILQKIDWKEGKIHGFFEETSRTNWFLVRDQRRPWDQFLWDLKNPYMFYNWAVPLGKSLIW